MSKTLANLHLNSAVYELMERADGQGTEALYKQINNPLMVQGVVIERRIQETWNQIEEEMCTHFEVTPDDINKYGLYPMDKIPPDQPINMTLVYGWMINWTKPDLTAPVAVPADDPAKREEALKRAMTPMPFIEPFFMIVPETDEYMFSISLDHVPPTAITKYVPGQQHDPVFASDTPPLPLGVDMAQAYIHPDDAERFHSVMQAVKKYTSEWEKNHGEPPKEVNFLEMDLIGEGKQFSTEEELQAFVKKYAYLYSTCMIHSEEGMQ